MTNEVYRFRTIDHLLGEHKELENQEIYFATPEDLNDPMEGMREIYWQGDSILWVNLFEHYILWLQHCFSQFIICGNKHRISKEDIPVFSNKLEHPSPIFSELHEEIKTNCFQKISINEIAEKLSNRKIRRKELILYFFAIHQTTLETIHQAYAKRKLAPDGMPAAENNNRVELKNLIEMIDAAVKEHNAPDDVIETICAGFSHIQSQMHFIHRYNADDSIFTDNVLFVFSTFPEDFVQALEKVIYPEWYTACFSNDYRNSSVWGHYGDNHKGVCLIFNTSNQDGKHAMQLNGINGWSSNGAIYGNWVGHFHEVNYEKKFPEVDFFRSLGRLRMPIIQRCWYRNEHGEISSYANDVFENEDAWRENYWDIFIDGVTTKLKDWEYEEEARLILNSLLGDEYSDGSSRKMKYDFKDLTGIIFGIKTSTADKTRLINIIKEKCQKEKRDDFKFYQAEYSPEKGSIERIEMNFIR